VTVRRVLIAGCGDLGVALGLSLCRAGWEVHGLRRNAALLPESFHRIAADLGEPESLAALGGIAFDHLVLTGAPGGFEEANYRRVYVDGVRNLLTAVVGEPGVLMVGSTGVYHQEDGSWVDEDSPTEPRGFSGRALLEGESIIRSMAGARGSVLRLGGIYGPGRLRLLSDVRAGIGCPAAPVRYTNRIHRDDAAAILQFLLERQAAAVPLAPCYVGVDCEPAPMWEVRHWIAARMGVALDDTRGSTDQRGGNKRCSNHRLLAVGYRFLYPDFRAGYSALLAGAQ
jgi:nucleoside-diphosphate-sugar epimerase